MRQQWLTTASDREAATEPGRELDRLPLDDAALNRVLRDVQLREFESVFDVYQLAASL